MDHQQVIDYSLQKPGTSLRYPFDPAMPVLFVGSKMFALLSSHQGRPSMNLKGAPDSIDLVREMYPDTVLPGYHMNKRHWNTVLLDGVLGERELLDMVDESYLLVCQGMPKKDRPFGYEL